MQIKHMYIKNNLDLLKKSFCFTLNYMLYLWLMWALRYRDMI
jgi:hypothetical protein